MVDDLASIWSRVRADLSASVPRSTFDLWLAPLSLAAVAGGRAYVSAPDATRRWVERRYLALLDETVRRHAPDVHGVVLVPPAQPAARRSCDSAADPELSSRYTFDTFVIGEPNRFAHAASLAVAEVPGQAYNPLFLFGPPGLGKTHLMGAIASYLRANAPGVRTLYTTAETFTRQFTGALHRGSPDNFKARFRAVDVLLIDDVQFLEGKPRTEEEFFHTFNALYESGSQLVLSADRSPHQLGSLADRLRDRFEWGLLAELAPPDPNTRLALLRKLAPTHGIADPPPGTLEAVASRAGSNVRALQGALTAVAATASLTGCDVEPSLVQRTLPGSGAEDQSPDVPTRIRAATARELGVTEASLSGPGRASGVVRARHIAIYLTRRLTSLSLPEIGRLYGGRDHSTVHGAVQRVRARIDSDPATSDLVERLLIDLGRPDS